MWVIQERPVQNLASGETQVLNTGWNRITFAGEITLNENNWTGATRDIFGEAQMTNVVFVLLIYFSATTSTVLPSVIKEIVPLSIVLKISLEYFCNLSIASIFGCPYLLSLPALIIEYSGLI